MFTKILAFFERASPSILKKCFLCKKKHMRDCLCSISLITILMISCTTKKDHFSEFSHQFTDGEIVGTLDNEKINEASGLDASIVNGPTTYWTLNDSQGEAKVFLINNKGQFIASALVGSTKNRDWEDITTGPGPDSTKSYVYVADIGDNRAIYDVKYIYRLEEPRLSKGDAITLTSFDSIRFQLPDKRRDTEAVFIDQLTNDLYVFSKREKQVNLYRLPYPQSTDSVCLAEFVLTLPITQVVAADYDASTGELLVKNYDSIYYWKKSARETFVEMLSRKALHLAYTPEPQGEAICFDTEGHGYYTLSEAKKDFIPALLFYKRQ